MTYYGIYKITNMLNGKMYIGKHKTCNLDDGYMGSSTWLKRSMKKHGMENFRKEWMMFCEDEDEMNYMERVFVDQTWVDRADTYNLKVGGEGGSQKGRKPWNKGKTDVYSEATKEKMRYNHKGMLGKKHRKASLEKMKKPKPKGFESRMSGRKNHFYGKHHTEEVKTKIRKPVLQFDNRFNVIQRYDSNMRASEMLNIPKTRISTCCNNTALSTHGYHFALEEDCLHFF